jgi:hypothetical protein
MDAPPLERSKKVSDAMSTNGEAQTQGQPLELLRQFLEDKKHHALEKKDRDEAWMLLMLLDSFENAYGIRAYVKDKMTYCEHHGLVPKASGYECLEFDCWYECDRQECSLCKFERELNLG